MAQRNQTRLKLLLRPLRRREQQARQLFDVQKQIRATMGDWQTVVNKAKSPQLSAQNLTKDYNGNLSASFVVDNAQPALAYTNHGTFTPVATADLFGKPVTVPETDLKRYAAVESVYEKALATIPDGPAKADGLAWGQHVAEAILAVRSKSGYDKPVPGQYSSTEPGKWRETPPDSGRRCCRIGRMSLRL